MRVRRLTVAELTPQDLRAWSELESRAAEPNAFLSPHFVLPALRHLDPDLQPILLAVEISAPTGIEWLGVGIFRVARGSPLLPLPHLVGYLSRHSFLGGLLVDRDRLDEVVGLILQALHTGPFGWPVLVLPKVHSDGLLAQAAYEWAAQRGLHAHRVGLQGRAMLYPRSAGSQVLRDSLGRRYNELERCRRRLGEIGPLSWHCVRDDAGAAEVEHFLDLEHQGWKADQGSSLRASPVDELFFKEVVQGFAGERRALFTELRVGGRTVASTSNFISGDAGFAFKVGWAAELRKYGPGMLNEAEFVRHAPEVCADLQWFDSGAAPDSFINKIWSDQRELATLVVPLTRLGELGLRVATKLRRAAHWMKR